MMSSLRSPLSKLRKPTVIFDPSKVSTAEELSSGWPLSYVNFGREYCTAAKLFPVNLQNFRFRVAYFPRSLASKSIFKSLSVSSSKFHENLIASKFSDYEAEQYSLRILWKLIISQIKKITERTDDRVFYFKDRRVKIYSCKME